MGYSAYVSNDEPSGMSIDNVQVFLNELKAKGISDWKRVYARVDGDQIHQMWIDLENN